MAVCIYCHLYAVLYILYITTQPPRYFHRPIALYSFHTFYANVCLFLITCTILVSWCVDCIKMYWTFMIIIQVYNMGFKQLVMLEKKLSTHAKKNLDFGISKIINIHYLTLRLREKFYRITTVSKIEPH